MDLFIFKTDIVTEDHIQKVSEILNNHPKIIGWSVDTEDIDKVMRIETRATISEAELIGYITSGGFVCEALPD